MKNLIFIFIFLFLFLFGGCFYYIPKNIDNNKDLTSEIPRFTQEKIEIDNGDLYLVVTFSNRLKEHYSFVDEETGEYVVVSKID